MKKFLFLVVITIISIYFIFKLSTDKFARPDYLSDNVLDIGRPINVNIDTDLLKRLDPAYE